MRMLAEQSESTRGHFGISNVTWTLVDRIAHQPRGPCIADWQQGVFDQLQMSLFVLLIFHSALYCITVCADSFVRLC